MSTTATISWSPDVAIRKTLGSDPSLRIGIFWPYSRSPVLSRAMSLRNPDVMDIRNHVALAHAVEDAGIDFALLADGYAAQSEAGSRVGFQDPSTHGVITAVPLLMATKQLGFLSTIHTTYVHPVHIARMGAHLDWLSGGRWGWNIVAGGRQSEATLFGYDDVPEHDYRYAVIEETVEIVKRLWTDVEVHHHGQHYRVDGRMRGPRPPTRPLLVSAASSDRGRQFAVAHCDYLFATIQTLDQIDRLNEDLSRKSMGLGRQDPLKMLVLADLFIRDEPGRAQAEFDELMHSPVDAQAEARYAIQVAQMVRGANKSGDMLAFVGTTDEVAEQILAARARHQFGGLIVRMPLWHASEGARIKPVLQKLQEAGIWTPPGERRYMW
jgi:FMNH2-dependent dimethyl sulfone monooxygenase